MGLDVPSRSFGTFLHDQAAVSSVNKQSALAALIRSCTPAAFAHNLPARALNFLRRACALLRHITTLTACTKRCATCTRLRQSLLSLSSSHWGWKESSPG